MQKLHSGITTLSLLGASKHGFVGRRVDPYGMMIRATTQHTKTKEKKIHCPILHLARPPIDVHILYNSNVT